jgi:hypothetical protein
LKISFDQNQLLFTRRFQSNRYDSNALRCYEVPIFHRFDPMTVSLRADEGSVSALIFVCLQPLHFSFNLSSDVPQMQVKDSQNGSTDDLL